MKRKLIPLTLLGVLILSAWSVAQVSSFQPESRLWVEGTSTIHDWTMTAEKFDGNVEAPAAENVEAVTVSVAVKDLTADNGTMNRKAHDALKADDHPFITYKLNSAELADAMDSGVFKLQTTGELTIAGVTKPVTFSVKGEQLADGNARYTGSTKLLMSDFNVKPPKAMLGTLKTGNEVVVHFDVVVAK